MITWPVTLCISEARFCVRALHGLKAWLKL